MNMQDFFEITDIAEEKELAEIARQFSAEKEGITMKRMIRKHRLIPAAAAVAAALCMGLGAAAYGFYHKESVQKYFGITGEELLAEYGATAGQTFANENATFTVDALLYDGHSALAVVTVEALDPDYVFPHDDILAPDYLCDENGIMIVPRTDKYKVEYGEYSFWSDADLPANQCRFAISFNNMEEWNGETLYFRFAWPDDPVYPTIGYKAAGRELLDGLIVSFTMERNCDCYTMQAEDGREVQLSAFSLLIDTADMGLSEADAVEKLHDLSYKLIYQDGTEQEVTDYSGYLNAKKSSVASVILATSRAHGDEDFAVGFRTDGLAAIEIDGVRYDKT